MSVTRLLFFFILFCTYSYGQTLNKNRISKTFSVGKDTISLETVAISPIDFKVQLLDGTNIPEKAYYFNAQKSQLYFYNASYKKIKVIYYKYPDFITQTYSPFDKKLIIPRATPSSKIYALKKTFGKNDFFGGINTYGNITRGITVGNNQGSVLNSGLDLQITGNLSEKLKIRASINDSNIPIQENGVSQNLREFDRVFIELFTDTWNLKAGDVDLENNDSYFLSFRKKINGAKLDVTLDRGDQKTTITASGAVVRGKFTTQIVTPQEGNQGPYRLQGANGELNIVVISGSETIYINGKTLKRGEQNDYTIDYNTSEIIFNPTFPINASQRIYVDFQYSDRNYNRFVTHNGITYENDKFSIGTYFYNESDVKNQSLQQNLNETQKQVLRQAGNNPNLMFAQSAQITEFDSNRILYKKHPDGYFEHSTSEDDLVYNVTFSIVPLGEGDYILSEATAQGNIYTYEGPGLGNYAPEIQLIAPSKTQMAIVKADYKIGKKSFVETEVAYSNNDLNLFSDLDDQNNQGLATRLAWKQQISTGNWQSFNQLDIDFVQRNFNNIEGLYNVEFNRDWNLNANINPNSLGNQTYLKNALTVSQKTYQKMALETEYLSLGSSFSGLKNGLTTENRLKKLQLKTQTSFLSSKDTQQKGRFLRNVSTAQYPLKKAWLQGMFNFENNLLENEQTKLLDANITQKYIVSGLELGLGDSTKVYTKLKFNVTQIDSVKNNRLQRVQNAQNYALESQWIKNKNTSFNTFANYRKVHHFFTEDVAVINGRALYNQRLFRNLFVLNTLYETSSGTTPLQNFNYIETEPGQGFYTYLGDLNNNGVKDFDEFEIAQFADQANYLRVLLPNTSRIATQKAKLSQSIFINFTQFKNHASTWLKTLSHFSNQSTILINKDQLKRGKKTNVNPFAKNSDDVIGLQQNITSSLFFNRGQQHYSTTYTFKDLENTQSISTDIQTTEISSHELNFQHNIKSTWVLANTATLENNLNKSSFASRNFEIKTQKTSPSISFLKDEFSTIEAVYTFQTKENKQGEETLTSHNLGLNYNYNSLDKGSVLASINLIENKYNGSLNSPASYRILEGLQPDRNYTWSLTVQRKLTQLLDLSLNYNGRQNNSTRTIHIGSVQLRANF